VKNVKNIIIVSIVSIIILLLIVPTIIETIKMNNQLKYVYDEVDNTLEIKKGELDSSYSEYYDIKSLEYEIDKVYYTKFKKHGIEIKFNVDSSYTFSEYSKTKEIEYKLALYSLMDLLDDLKKELEKKQITLMDYKYTLKINDNEICNIIEGSTYEEYINEAYEENKIEIKKDKIVWEYTNKGLKLKSLTLYMTCILAVIAVELILFIYFVIVVFVTKGYEKLNVESKFAIGIVGKMILYIVGFILLGLITGGAAFIFIPLLWLLNNRKWI